MPRTARRTADQPRLLELLWTPATRIGRSGTTVGGIVDGAVGLADEQGLDALTMRAVAERVGVGAMTLYGYLPGRAELLELMLDRVAATAYDGHPRPADRPGWRAGLEHVAARNLEHQLAHPWLVEVPASRPVLGPGICAKYELELAPLDGLGLGDLEIDHVLTAVLGLVSHAARWQVGLDRVRADSRLDDEQWWALSQPVIGPRLAAMDLPISSRVGQSVASAGEPRDTLAVGLGLLLDGLAHRLAGPAPV